MFDKSDKTKIRVQNYILILYVTWYFIFRFIYIYVQL